MSKALSPSIPAFDGRAAERVFYDGGCPVCRREIGWYRTMRGGERVTWVDIDALDGVPEGLPDGYTRDALMRRFTIQRRDGAVVSGGPGFIALWRALGPLRWLGLLTDHKPGAFVGERLYRAFLRIRTIWR